MGKAVGHADRYEENRWGFTTRAIHKGQTPDPVTGATIMPIYQTSTYTQKLDGNPAPYEYARGDSPNRDALEEALASLEGGDFAVSFASGMAAGDAVLRRLAPGDHIIAGADLYGGVYRLLESIYRPQGIRTDYCDLSRPDWVNRIQPATRLVWLETPTNPLLQIAPMEFITEAAHRRNLEVVVDNTFASPYLQNPLQWGADLVMHSMTKYIAGHSDVIGGIVAGRSTSWREHLTFVRNAAGAVISPFDAWLTLRGLKTLALRMERHSENAGRIAEWLAAQPAVGAVYYPGRQRGWQQQMRLPGGMVSFVLKDAGAEEAFRVLRRLRVFSVAESLGGVESLASHPATMTHAALPPEERERRGIVAGLIRLSVGIEDLGDLLADLEQALAPS